MKNKWNYQGLSEASYGQEIVYQKAAQFLGDTVEDWGCGTGWAKRYFRNYRGIDGSLSSFIPNPKDLIDLVYYTSQAENILLRQVLEHNYEWRKILENAVKSFQKKLCITIHTPIKEETQEIFLNDLNVPDIAFKREDILDYLKDFKVFEEFVPTAPFEYGEEWIIYVEKI